MRTFGKSYPILFSLRPFVLFSLLFSVVSFCIDVISLEWGVSQLVKGKEICPFIWARLQLFSDVNEQRVRDLSRKVIFSIADFTKTVQMPHNTALCVTTWVKKAQQLPATQSHPPLHFTCLCL